MRKKVYTLFFFTVFISSCVDEHGIVENSPAAVLDADSILAQYRLKYKANGIVNIGEMSKKMYIADSTNPEFAVSYATCLLANAKIEDAKYLCKKAINIDTNYSQAYWNLGICQMVTNRDSGYFYFNKALTKNPNWYYYLLLSKYHEEDSLYADALADINKAIQGRPNMVDLKIFRAKYKNFNKDPKGALDDLKNIPEHRKNDPDVYNIFAVSYVNLGKFKDAIENCDKGLLINPENIYLLYLRALAETNIDKPYDALEDLKKCADLGSVDCRFYYEKLSESLKNRTNL